MKALMNPMSDPFSLPDPAAEAAWVASAQHGDLEAYAELVRRHRFAVLGYLAVRVAMYQDAEDLAQEVFVTAFRKI